MCIIIITLGSVNTTNSMQMYFLLAYDCGCALLKAIVRGGGGVVRGRVYSLWSTSWHISLFIRKTLFSVWVPYSNGACIHAGSEMCIRFDFRTMLCHSEVYILRWRVHLLVYVMYVFIDSEAR